jgi:drug/metabolite transporter (DMT)-like permease
MRHLLDLSAARNNLEGLPAVAAVAAISAASTATTMAAASTAAATSSTAISAAAPAATTAALSLRPRFIHHQVSPAEILSVKRVYGLVGVFVVGNFDEGEAT